MKENTRQAYLSALGISNYMPRWVLPGAPSSQACEWEIEQEEVAANEPLASAFEREDVAPPSASEPQARGRGPAPVDFDAVMADVAPSQKQKNQAKASKEARQALSPATTAQPAVEYSLTLWQLPGLLILDSRQSSLALPTDRLLQNILRVTHGKASLPRAEILRWPLVQSKSLAAGEDAAREHLAVLLQAKFQQMAEGQVSLWLLGESAAKFALPEGLSYSADLGHCRLTEDKHGLPAQTAVVVMPSLVDMLQQPLSKKTAWSALQQWLQQAHLEHPRAEHEPTGQ